MKILSHKYFFFIFFIFLLLNPTISEAAKKTNNNNEVKKNVLSELYIFTKDNQKILDFTGGIGVLNLGHNHPRILKTRIDFQNKKKLEVNKLYFSPYTAVLANNLANITKSSLTSNLKIDTSKKIPNTFVPGRNLLFYNLASSYAYTNNIENKPADNITA